MKKTLLPLCFLLLLSGFVFAQAATNSLPDDSTKIDSTLTQSLQSNAGAMPGSSQDKSSGFDMTALLTGLVIGVIVGAAGTYFATKKQA